MDMIMVEYVWQILSNLDRASIVFGGVFGAFLFMLWMLFGQLGRTSPRGINQAAATQVLMVVGLCLIAWWPSFSPALAAMLP
jgi:hypothetical protein